MKFTGAKHFFLREGDAEKRTRPAEAGRVVVSPQE
jgi:hypothetical protein